MVGVLVGQHVPAQPTVEVDVPGAGQPPGGSAMQISGQMGGRPTTLVAVGQARVLWVVGQWRVPWVVGRRLRGVSGYG